MKDCYWELQVVTRGNNRLQWANMGCRGLQNVKTSYWELQGVTWGYSGLQGLQRVTGSSKRLQEVTMGYPRVTGCYKGLSGGP